jgi:HSP20 family protein
MATFRTVKQYFITLKNSNMENKAVDKPRTSWPTLFDSGLMEKFFNAPLDEFFGLGKVMNVPAVNVNETDKEFALTIAAPGLDKKDFKVDAFDDMLTISAEKEKDVKEEKNGRFNRREYNYSSWSKVSLFLKIGCREDQCRIQKWGIENSNS